MHSLEWVSFTLDILLVVAGIAGYLSRPRIGGEMAKGLRVLLVGVVVLGFAHLLETLLFTLFHIAQEWNEIAHRLIVGSGFIFVIIGFLIQRRAFEE